ncbi:hypothetical protein PHMEG_00034839 [Phytophthora megakarya]|uniref:Reverse transcriptase n=1 Tax=Phytophthora megakarya TaxID=4795 RepID=A0A225UQG4_9STRA|nr:hypothetical protein PHMEG_00034839 [Phytophthora megakarya]
MHYHLQRMGWYVTSMSTGMPQLSNERETLRCTQKTSEGEDHSVFGQSWAPPIVIVLNKNGQDIRLCIDYKMVNAVTAIIEYAMPFVNDLLSSRSNASMIYQRMIDNALWGSQTVDEIDMLNE